ncbi:hypothetical protein [Zunongwangia sp. H14]|uniref:hypothetical protein n=1 Tax=Zunongwangia sp. H14 TaxID=3240792 RepID=UPI0035673E33
MMYQHVVDGILNNSEPNRNLIIFNFATQAPVDGNVTYTPSNTFVFIPIYLDENGNPFEGILEGNYNVSSDNEFRFTEITETYLEGIFSGTFYLSTDSSQTVSITDGEFKVPRITPDEDDYQMGR